METKWFPASREVQDTEVIKQVVGACVPEQKWNFACRLLGKGCHHHGKVLCCTSQHTEAANGLETLRQAFEGNLVSSRQR
jgi:hypothetical protein